MKTAHPILRKALATITAIALVLALIPLQQAWADDQGDQNGGSNRTIGLTVKFRNGYSSDQGKVQYSVDGTNWTDVTDAIDNSNIAIGNGQQLRLRIVAAQGYQADLNGTNYRENKASTTTSLSGNTAIASDAGLQVSETATSVELAGVEFKQSGGAQDGNQPMPRGSTPVTVNATSTGGDISVSVNEERFSGQESASINATRNVGNNQGTNHVQVQAAFTLTLDSLTINGQAIDLMSGAIHDPDDPSLIIGWEGDFAANDTYTIHATLGSANVRTIVWADTAGDFGEDAVVGHGKVIIDPGEGIANHTGTRSGGHYSVKVGTRVTIHVIPDYGYQLVTTNLNGVEVTAGAEVSSFTFTMPDTNLHFSAIFTKTDDSVQSSSSLVTAGAISGTEGVIDSGNLQLTVDDMDDTTMRAAMDAQKTNTADASLMYLDLNLSQVVNKGTVIDGVATADDAWIEQKTELDHAITVTFAISDELAATGGPFYIVREHDGAFERIECDYDAAAQTISFQTDRFSEYLLVRESSGAAKAALPATGDPFATARLTALALAGAAGLALGISRRKTSHFGE